MKVEQAKAMPGFSVEYLSRTFNELGQGNTSNRFSGIQAGISIPLWYKPWNGKIKEAKITSQMAENNYAFQQKELQNNISIIWQEYLQNIEVATYYKEQGLPQAEMLINNAVKSFSAGEIGYIEYIQYMNNAMAIKTGYLDNLNLYNQSVIELEYLAGIY